MNEYEISYWHCINLNRPKTWNEKPIVAIEKLLMHALVAKMNSVSQKEAEIFKTFIVHNYKDTMKLHWREFVAMIT
jgi:uncharacterized tellurite resistance protein B-like protein